MFLLCVFFFYVVGLELCAFDVQFTPLAPRQIYLILFPYLFYLLVLNSFYNAQMESHIEEVTDLVAESADKYFMASFSLGHG